MTSIIGVRHTSPKGALADYILQASGHSDWAMDTHRSARLFTVWNHVTRGTP